MQTTSIKSLALSVHRWIGLILAPLFLLIAISGGVLAVKPIVEDPLFAGAQPGADSTSVIPALQIADPKGQARQLTVTADGQAMILSSQAETGPNGIFSISSGQMVANATKPVDIFGIAKSLHKDLLLGAGLVVVIASYLMLGIILIGPFLGWLRFRNTITGWHLAAGWLALPFIIIAPLTGVLMSLHLGSGTMPVIQQSSPPLALAQGVKAVSENPDVKSITFVRRFQKGSVMVSAETAHGSARYVVDGSHKAQPLEGGPGLIKSLHEGIWAGAWSGLLNLAISIILTGLTLSGIWSWMRRWRQTRIRLGVENADILVAHASQTGTAARLAQATSRALEDGGVRVACMSLSGLRPNMLSSYHQVLIIASTTGQGVLAEPGRAFLHDLQKLSNMKMRFSILALGDRRYDHFCGGAETLRTALLKAGAEESIAMVRVDGAPEVAWQEWLSQVQGELGAAAVELRALQADEPVNLKLVERTRLDNPDVEDSGETWQVVFSVGGETAFRPGDLLMLSPGQGQPERCYSIGSSSLLDPDRLALTVSKHSWTDENGDIRLGRMSALLCRDMAVGTCLTGSIRHHPHFNPPEDPATPIIMVAAGCGVAPFTGFIEERSLDPAASGASWLMFGNRRREGDFLYGAELSKWQSEGNLTQLHTAFSRDSDDGSYITDQIALHGRSIVELIRDEGAILYVCGRTRLGRGVEEALVDALIANDNLSETEAEQTVQKWKATGSLRQDLFD